MAETLNSMRLLTQQQVEFIVREFPDSIHSADGVADYFGLPRDMVYKTLVVLPTSGKPHLILVAGSRELDLKKVARAIGQKKVQMAPHKEAERLTGLQTGGISPLALMHKSFPVYIDQPVLGLERLLVSAGKRGVNLELAVPDFLRLTKAKPIEAT
ncbi:MAG: aminoacyl-tRNA deacylase [Anaerolineae bacterium]|nr:aminoacyl-tRNA deacylase [Anaerolineae bacterium]